MEYLVLILAVNIAAILIAAHKGEEWLRWLIAVQMIILGATVKKLFDYGIGISNVGNIFFANVFLIQSLIYFRYGTAAVLKTVYTTLFAAFTFGCLRILVSNTPTVMGNEEIAGSLQAIVLTEPLVFVGSFLGMYCSMQVLIFVLSKIENKWLGYLSAIVIAQIVDSLIFFPIVFANEGSFTMMTTGFTVKLILGVLMMPLLLLCGRGAGPHN